MRFLLFGVPGLLAVVIAWSLTPLTGRLAVLLGAVDAPSGRKIHNRPIPRLGGVAVVVASALVFAGASRVSPWISPDPVWTGVGLGLLPVFIVSLLDDVLGLGVPVRILGQAAGAIVALSFGITLNPDVHLFGRTIHIGVLAAPISLLWLIGVTNAFNLVDGLDGLSAGLALISSGSLVVIFLVVHQIGVALSASILAGALLGFLPYNLYPAKIFLGDCGATAIGFLLACLTLRGGSTLSAGFATLLPMIILGLPVADTLLSMTRRALSASASGRPDSVFRADRSHIHHRLMDRIGHRRAVLTLYGVGLALAATSLLSILLNVQEAGLLLTAMLLAGFVGVARLGYQEFAVIRSGLVLRFYDTPVLKRSLFVVFLDLIFVACATYAAVGLKYDDWALLEHRRLAVAMAATLGPVTVVVLWLMGLYQGSWRLASIYDAVRICVAVLIASTIGFLTIRLTSSREAALSLFGIYALVKMTVASGSRLSYRILAASRMRAQEGVPVLIYGAGVGGVNALREMRANQAVGMRPVGFIDDDPSREHRAVDGVPIVGSHEQLEDRIRELGARAVVISTLKIGHERQERARQTCVRTGATLLRMQVRFDVCGGPEELDGAVRSAARRVPIGFSTTETLLD
jgi:UDP-GlcNAc:undecaprenyl-phosphate/decaprenyl-phosphate GlcNAc-1-phosphate transferase